MEKQNEKNSDDYCQHVYVQLSRLSSAKTDIYLYANIIANI